MNYVKLLLVAIILSIPTITSLLGITLFLIPLKSNVGVVR